jgi:hypothetical protein
MLPLYCCDSGETGIKVLVTVLIHRGLAQI